MKSLKDICKQFGKKKCHPDVFKWSLSGEHREAEEISVLPTGDELDKLDEICKKCESSYIRGSKKECPYCDSIEVGITGASFVVGTLEEIQLECYNCALKFWISKSIYKP